MESLSQLACIQCLQGKLYDVLIRPLGDVGTGYGPRCCWQPALQQPQQSRPWHGQDGVPVFWLC